MHQIITSMGITQGPTSLSSFLYVFSLEWRHHLASFTALFAVSSSLIKGLDLLQFWSSSGCPAEKTGV